MFHVQNFEPIRNRPRNRPSSALALLFAVLYENISKGYQGILSNNVMRLWACLPRAMCMMHCVSDNGCWIHIFQSSIQHWLLVDPLKPIFCTLNLCNITYLCQINSLTWYSFWRFSSLTYTRWEIDGNVHQINIVVR